MDELILRAEPRTILGKKVSQLRRAGQVPGVVYGPGVDSTVAVSVDRKEFDRFFHNYGHDTIFTLTWGEGDQRQVQVREVQVHPVKQTSLHVDFYAPAPADHAAS